MSGKKTPVKSTADPSVNADRFFATIKHRDIVKSRKVASSVLIVALVFMFIVALLAVLALFAVTMKPTPVIAFDSEGKRTVFAEEETIQSETSVVRVHRFLTEFINKYEGVSPNIEEDLTEAYNMLTPKFRQILLDKAVHKEKIEAWKNKNFETKFKLLKLKFLKGSLSVGSTLAVEGYGEMIFKNAVDYNGEGTQRKDYVYFTALMIVTPISLDLSPDGLFIDVFTGHSAGDFRSLRAYLNENNKGYLLDDDDKGTEVFN